MRLSLSPVRLSVWLLPSRAMRGRLNASLAVGWPLRGGISPASAAQSVMLVPDPKLGRDRRFATDSPRTCGADAITAAAHMRSVGPSPRVRGRPPTRGMGRRRGGTIPARAGPTGGCTRTARARRDHPRACGADAGGERIDVELPGPSPRTRGSSNRPISIIFRVMVGPAHAGIIPSASTAFASSISRPRARGDHPSLEGCGRQPGRCQIPWYPLLVLR